MKLLPGDAGHRPLAYTGIYELPVSRGIAALAKQGGHLIDVGANAGYFSLLWCGLRTGNTVDAFEALPANVERVRYNIERNKMAEKIQLHAYALGKSDGVIAFECGPAEQSGWAGIAAGKTEATFEVRMQRLDGVITQLTKPTAVKIDCEGADPWVLEGARGLLTNPLLRNVFFEVNGPRQAALGIAHDASQQVLQSVGFRCEQISPDEWHAFKS
ncbi:FkbM family methyltransferase [Prosthecobacter sp.]|uniref:FkbM family methyltransferase n=1 Tax=Prosthecobacter sp. TaxID=1965333 RepID=UPI00378515C8